MIRKFRRAVAATGLVAVAIVGPGGSDAAWAGETAPAVTDASAATPPAAPAPTPSDKAIYDKIWGLANLYHNTDNPWIEDFSIVGRQQNDLYYFHANQGTEEDLTNRRTRIGFKAKVFQDFTVHTEVDLNLEPKGQTYGKLTDAYVKWSPSKMFNFTVGKQSAKFTLDGSISSTQLLTIDRSNIANNFWFPDEYIPGISINGDVGNWMYNIGYFTAGQTTREFGKFNGGSFALFSGGYNFAECLGVDKALLRLDYVYQDKNPVSSFTRSEEHVGSLNFQLEKGRWGLGTDVDASRGYGSQPNLFGLELMPSYKITDTWQVVFRYTYLDSSGKNGIRLARYENAIVGGRGDNYNEAYLGLNKYFYGQKLKWQTGIQYTAMDDAAHDVGKYSGWGVTTGLRVSW